MSFNFFFIQLPHSQATRKLKQNKRMKKKFVVLPDAISRHCLPRHTVVMKCLFLFLNEIFLSPVSMCSFHLFDVFMRPFDIHRATRVDDGGFVVLLK